MNLSPRLNSINTSYLRPSNIQNTKRESFSSPISKDTVSFGHSNSISAYSLKNKTAKEFFSNISIKSPDKCRALLSNNKIAEYAELDYGYFSDEYPELHKKDLEALQASIDKLSPDEIKYVTDAITKRLHGEQYGEKYLSGLALYASDKKAFERVINSPYKADNCMYSSGYANDECRLVLNLPVRVASKVNMNSLLLIEESQKKTFNYDRYTEDSDSFKRNKEASQKMSEYLATQITQGDFPAYRGERSTWIFDTIPIDDKLAKKVKFLTFINRASRKDRVFPNNNKFGNYDASKFDSVYTTIMQKEKLTLADAMLVAKYGNETFVNNILDLINSSAIKDYNFKSLTLDENFAENWAQKTGTGPTDKIKMPTIVESINVKKGNQAGYCITSGQFEVILNDNPKTMTFNKAAYDKETDTFYLACDIAS